MIPFCLSPVGVGIVGSVGSVVRVTVADGGVEKDSAKLFSYYENRQFKWLNPRGVDYSNLSDKRGAPNYRD